jgi:hypothetical protein
MPPNKALALAGQYPRTPQFGAHAPALAVGGRAVACPKDRILAPTSA